MMLAFSSKLLCLSQPCFNIFAFCNILCLSSQIVINVFSLLEYKAYVFFSPLFFYITLTQWRAPGRQAADELPKPLDKSGGLNQWRGRVWCKFLSVWKHCLPHLTQLIMKLSLMSINGRTLVSSQRLSVLREMRGWHYCDSITNIRTACVHTLRPYTGKTYFSEAIRFVLFMNAVVEDLTLCEGNKNSFGWIVSKEMGEGEYFQLIKVTKVFSFNNF